MATVQNLFAIDGIYYNVFIPEGGIHRKFAVTDTDEAGRTQGSGIMVRDIIGTFYNYTIDLATNFLSPEEYDELYQILSSPQDSHLLTFPYGQGFIELEMYVTGGEDSISKITDGVRNWTGLTVDFISMEPIDEVEIIDTVIGYITATVEDESTVIHTRDIEGLNFYLDSEDRLVVSYIQ